MKKIRLSYSLLSLWERGDIEGAIDTYFHLDKKGTEAMENGKRVHKEIEEHIKTYNTFPEWFFDYPLTLPETEKEVVVSYNEMFDLKGVFDCLDPVEKTLFEFKTGNSDSLEWARTWQLPIYFLIAELGKIDIDKAILIRNNGKESDFVVVHNSKRLRDKARNIVDSLGPEIYEYFTKEGLI
jgi:hypothetical protein